MSEPEAPRLNLDQAALSAFMMSGGGTQLYDAARQLSDDTIGHAETCEWHGNGHAYCSCPAYGAACAGVDAVLEALASESGGPCTRSEPVVADALPDGHPLPWNELVEYERQQGGYWLYGPHCDVYGNGKIWVRVSRPQGEETP